MSEVVREYGALIGVLGCVIIMFAYFYYQRRRGVVARRRQFKERKPLAENEWFTGFYPLISEEAQRTAREVLEALADEIGVHWTQLRPEDSFEETLRVEAKYQPIDDLEAAELRIVELATARGIKEIPPPGFTGALSGFLGEWLELNGCSPPLFEEALRAPPPSFRAGAART